LAREESGSKTTTITTTLLKTISTRKKPENERVKVIVRVIVHFFACIKDRERERGRERKREEERGRERREREREFGCEYSPFHQTIFCVCAKRGKGDCVFV
jgi:hypothetical protein